MPRTKSFGLLLAGLLAAPLACGPRSGTDVGNGATVTFNVRGFERKPPTSPASITLENGARIDEVWIAVEKLRLAKGASCTAGAEDLVQADGPFVADLLGAGIIEVALPEAKVEVGDYCRVGLDLHELKADERPSTAPVDLVGAALTMKGVREDGTPFTLRTKAGLELVLGAKGGSFRIEDGVPFIIGVELSEPIEALELESLTGSTLVIDETTNSDRLEAFNQALKRATRLFVDEDDDGDLSDGESGEDKEVAIGE